MYTNMFTKLSKCILTLRYLRVHLFNDKQQKMTAIKKRVRSYL